MDTTHVHVSVSLSKRYKGRARPEPVWVMRYRLPSGKDSRQVLGRAWTRKGRPPTGYLSQGDALMKAEGFAAEHSYDTLDGRRAFGVALASFLRDLEVEKGLRGSTVHGYRRIGTGLSERPWRSGMSWAERPLDNFAGDDLLVVRRELVQAKRSPHTLNHYRRVVRGVFGTHPGSPALAWPWSGQREESEGRLRFYTPEQVRKLLAQARSDVDRAIFTLATQAGPRLSEIRALKVANVDFNVGVLRFEDGYTTNGGHAGNKGRRVRSVPLSADVRVVLEPFCEDKGSDELVFQHEAKPGEPICGTGVYRRFVGAAERAQLPRLAFHDLRHSFGTQAIRAFNIYEVQRMMGHRHITTTERYLHYAPDPDAAAKLTSLWSVDEERRDQPRRPTRSRTRRGRTPERRGRSLPSP
ncbi:MAG: tyrosine-type recombinase/integrase [Solirubrobacteraceae bacterium]